MTLSNTPQRWGALAQVLHWVMFLLIVGAWFAVETREDFPKGSAERTEWMLLHKSLGLSVFFLVWVRIGARFSQVTPAALGNAFQQRLSMGVALGLYALMIALPVTGMLASWYEARPVAWFGLFELPALVDANEHRVEVLEELHEAGFNVLLGLLGLHVVGALYHQFVLKDGLIRRMTP